MNVIDGIGLAKDVSVVLKLENIFLFDNMDEFNGMNTKLINSFSQQLNLNNNFGKNDN